MKLPDTGYMRLTEILRVLPICRTTWWKGVKEGRYPKGVKISERVTAWKVEDIQALIEKLNREAA